MRIKFLYLLVVFFLYFSCDSSKKKSDVNTKVKESTQKDSALIKNKQKAITNNYKDILNVYLIGMEFVEPTKAESDYEKYAVDFTGACYSSDLLKMKITDKEVLISNYYEPNINNVFQIDNINTSNDSLIIRINSKAYFKIYKIKDIPVYSLEYKGKLNTKIRMSKFISKESDIEKFGGIDCGDFDG